MKAIYDKATDTLTLYLRTLGATEVAESDEANLGLLSIMTGRAT